MGAAALVRCADDDMILSNDHVLARTLDQEAKKLLHQSFVGTLNGTMAVTYAIGEEIVAYRAAVRFEALFSADVAKKRGRRYSLAPCAPDPEGDDPAGGLLLLAHDRRECIRVTVDAAGIVAAGRFELARVAA
ncbi:hypothetical protein JL721_9458 [Aureococcus anophagefferens]|nr:hypothetical protein JL721_9458 [Aureococcus anophagefferens]